MNYSTYRISLDIHKPDSNVVLNAKRGDTNRKIFISLTDGSVPYHISEECYAVFTATKPDGKIVYNECTIEDCVIIYKFTDQTVAAEGMMDCEIKLYGADNELITSPRFIIMVHGTVYDEGDEVESSDEFSALTKLVTDAKLAIDEANQAAEDANDAVKSINDIMLSGKIVKTVNGVAPDENGNVQIEVGSGSDGLDSKASALLITILRNGVYSTDQSANITALENALASGGSGGEEEPDIPVVPDEPDEPDVPVVKTYTISNELVNVSSSNAATSVNENASYTATLTADEGYALESVTVTMGGVDVTADVYADGVISIPAVTGNVEILASATEEPKEAVLNTDGLLGFFDLRNKPNNSGNGSTGYYDAATVGDGRLYSWAQKGEGDEYGAYMNGREFCAGASYTVHDFGTEFTWLTKMYSDANYTLTLESEYTKPGNMGTTISPKYNTSDGAANVTSTTIPKVAPGYHSMAIVVSGATLRIYRDSVMVASYDGADIEGFVSWYSKFKVANAYTGTVKGHVAFAFYKRALSETEVVEMDEYMKTLEVA